MRPVQRLDYKKTPRQRHLSQLAATPDRLATMFEMQRRFGSRFCSFNKLSERDKEEWTKEFVVCMYDELSEVLNWTNWKHWKKTRKKVEVLQLAAELIDIWHFLMDLCLVWGIDADEFYEIYIAKNEENHARQRRGY